MKCFNADNFTCNFSTFCRALSLHINGSYGSYNRITCTVYHFNSYSGDDVFNIFRASLHYTINDDTPVFFHTFGRDMVKIDKPPFIAVCISKNKY